MSNSFQAQVYLIRFFVITSTIKFWQEDDMNIGRVAEDQRLSAWTILIGLVCFAVMAVMAAFSWHEQEFPKIIMILAIVPAVVAIGGTVVFAWCTTQLHNMTYGTLVVQIGGKRAYYASKREDHEPDQFLTSHNYTKLPVPVMCHIRAQRSYPFAYIPRWENGLCTTQLQLYRISDDPAEVFEAMKGKPIQLCHAHSIFHHALEEHGADSKAVMEAVTAELRGYALVRYDFG